LWFQYEMEEGRGTWQMIMYRGGFGRRYPLQRTQYNIISSYDCEFSPAAAVWILARPNLARRIYLPISVGFKGHDKVSSGCSRRYQLKPQATTVCVCKLKIWLDISTSNFQTITTANPRHAQQRIIQDALHVRQIVSVGGHAALMSIA